MFCQSIINTQDYKELSSGMAKMEGGLFLMEGDYVFDKEGGGK